MDDKYEDLISQYTAEYNEMKESVETYGGFYVGRYETSWNGSSVATVANVTPMSGSTDLGESWICNNDGTLVHTATWYGLYAKQKELYNEESYSVVSGMIYGCQWDAIMDWMSDIVNPNAVDKDNNLFIFDSTGMGNYGFKCPDCNGVEEKNDNCEICYGRGWAADSESKLNTGTNSDYCVRNIFDLAGNYCEVTQELYEDDDSGETSRYCRGGSSAAPYARYVTNKSNCCCVFPWYEIEASSRLQLYIK